jgi:peptidoglycan/LPS O-acetylase OafA/YrhL
MFGAYRTFLAVAVAVQHLLSVPVVGSAAVHAFFILSGYLMTRIMNETYGYSRLGVARFAVNRLLRIYPSYLVALLVALGILAIVEKSLAEKFSSNIYVPSSPAEWFANITLVHFRLNLFNLRPLVLPPSWALTIELLFYTVIGLGLGSSRKISLVWFCSSVFATAWLIWWSGASSSYSGWSWIYFSIVSGSLPFSIGAMIFHYGPRSVQVPSLRAFTILLACGFAFLASCALFLIANRVVGSVPLSLAAFYANMAVQACIVAALASVMVVGRVAQWDKEVGDYSYLIYLLHFPVAIAVSHYIFDGIGPGRSIVAFGNFLLAMVVCVAIAFLVLKCLVRPLEEFRRRVRKMRAIEDEGRARRN